MAKKNKNLILIGLLVLIAIGIFIIAFKPVQESNEYKKILCAGLDFGEGTRYETYIQAQNLITQNEGVCTNDCANYCPKINMKYSRSSVTGNADENRNYICGENSTDTWVGKNMYNCLCYCK